MTLTFARELYYSGRSSVLPGNHLRLPTGTWTHRWGSPRRIGFPGRDLTASVQAKNCAEAGSLGRRHLRRIRELPGSPPGARFRDATRLARRGWQFEHTWPGRLSGISQSTIG